MSKGEFEHWLHSQVALGELIGSGQRAELLAAKASDLISRKHVEIRQTNISVHKFDQPFYVNLRRSPTFSLYPKVQFTLEDHMFEPNSRKICPSLDVDYYGAQSRILFSGDNYGWLPHPVMVTPRRRPVFSERHLTAIDWVLGVLDVGMPNNDVLEVNDEN